MPKKKNGDHDLLIRIDERVSTIFKEQKVIKGDIDHIKTTLNEGEGKILGNRESVIKLGTKIRDHVEEHEKNEQRVWKLVTIIGSTVVVAGNIIIWVLSKLWNKLGGA